MDAQEWSLVFFTVLTQLAVGLFLAAMVVRFFAARKSGKEVADRLIAKSVIAIIPLLILALIAALFHLGRALRFWRIFGNLDSSWLSWEVLLVVIFGVLIVVLIVRRWRKVSALAQAVVAWLAALVGLAAIYAMANIYMLDAAPSWHGAQTVVAFYIAAFLLGAVALQVFLMAGRGKSKALVEGDAGSGADSVSTTIRWLAVAAMFLLGAELVVAPWYLSHVTTSTSSGASLLEGKYWVLFNVRYAIAFIGAGILEFIVYRKALVARARGAIAGWVYGAFILLLAAELIGRVVFYAWQTKIGL